VLASVGDLRIELQVENVGPAQMSVALGLTRPNPARVYRYLDGGEAWIFRVEIQRAMHVLEGTTNVRHHHVARTEFCSGVAWLECPSCHQCPSSSAFGSAPYRLKLVLCFEMGIVGKKHLSDDQTAKTPQG